MTVSVRGAQHFVATMKDVKLLLTHIFAFLLALNNEPCAKLHTLMQENAAEENEKEPPYATNEIK